MTFRLEQKSPLGSEVARAALAEIDAAIHDLGASELSFDERVHETRKHVKRLRAQLELVRRAVDRPSFEQRDSALRDVAHALGPLRERAAQDECLEALARETPQDDDVARLRELTSPPPNHSAGEREHFLERPRSALLSLRKEIEALSIDGDDWAAIAEDFQRTYAAGRKAHRHATYRPGAEELHGLRRRAKRHQYQLALIETIWPGPIKARRDELATLGDELGEHHDLSLLQATLESASLPPALGTARRRLLSRIAARSRWLEASTLALAARLFAERPRRLSNRFGDYFRAWREAPQSAVVSK